MRWFEMMLRALPGDLQVRGGCGQSFKRLKLISNGCIIPEQKFWLHSPIHRIFSADCRMSYFIFYLYLNCLGHVQFWFSASARKCLPAAVAAVVCVVRA